MSEARMALTVEDASVVFGRGRGAVTAVDRVTLGLPEGGVLGLVGESGSGKSTLARAVTGLTPVTSGRILVHGEPVRSIRRGGGRPAPVQMVFQDPAGSLNPRLTVGDSITDALIARRVPSPSRSDEMHRLLDLVQLSASMADRRPHQLSGGQRQRVAIARALASRPTVLVCDEITSALDVSVQGAILNLVAELRRELRLSILFITHNLAVVRHVSDTIAVMRNGAVVEIGDAAELIQNPQHEYTRSLITAIPDPDRPIAPRSDAEFSFLTEYGLGLPPAAHQGDGASSRRKG